jgi:D-glycero-D-manno-heptose 1,7-bisphosphate phosphatase
MSSTGNTKTGDNPAHLHKAVFLDRDGVLTDNTVQYYLTRPEDLVLNPGVIETLMELRDRGFLLIVITNQGGISTGANTKENVEKVHARLLELLESAGIRLEEIYYCPHHQKTEACLCRKPLPLMLEKALARFRIEPGASWFIGDSDRDMEAGKAAGVQPVQVEANSDLRRVLPWIH